MPEVTRAIKEMGVNPQLPKDKVKSLLKAAFIQDPHIGRNSIDAEGDTALTAAIAKSSPYAVEWLLVRENHPKNGPEMDLWFTDSASDTLLTPLILAIRYRDDNIDIKDKNCRAQKQREVIQLLIKYGTDLEICGKIPGEGDLSPISFATLYGNLFLLEQPEIKAFIKKTIDESNDSNFTVKILLQIKYAMKGTQIYTMKFWLDHAKTRNGYKNFPELLRSVLKNILEGFEEKKYDLAQAKKFVKVIQEYGLEIDFDIFLKLIKLKDFELIKPYLNKIFESLTDERRAALLMAIAQSDDLVLLNYFLKEGIKVNSTVHITLFKKADICLALNAAAERGHADIFIRLLQAGAKYVGPEFNHSVFKSVDAEQKESPPNNKKRIRHFLLALNASLNSEPDVLAENMRELEPIDVLALRQLPQVQEVETTMTDLYFAALKGDNQLVEQLLLRVKNINDQVIEGQRYSSALLAAIAADKSSTANLLISNGAKYIIPKSPTLAAAQSAIEKQENDSAAKLLALAPLERFHLQITYKETPHCRLFKTPEVKHSEVGVVPAAKFTFGAI